MCVKSVNYTLKKKHFVVFFNTYNILFENSNWKKEKQSELFLFVSAYCVSVTAPWTWLSKKTMNYVNFITLNIFLKRVGFSSPLLSKYRYVGASYGVPRRTFRTCKVCLTDGRPWLYLRAFGWSPAATISACVCKRALALRAPHEVSGEQNNTEWFYSTLLSGRCYSHMLSRSRL